MAWDFTVESGLAVPPVSIAGLGHPFPWGEMKAGDSFVVPKAYWTDERGVEVFKTATAREKIKNSFRTWAKQDPKRGSLMPVLRTLDKDGSIRVWVENRPSGAPAPAKKAPAKSKK